MLNAIIKCGNKKEITKIYRKIEPRDNNKRKFIIYEIEISSAYLTRRRARA